MSSISAESYAAVDLGSNSFHMLVANYSGDRLHIIDRIKDMVRLASGLDQDNLLTPESMERALHCLEVFGQRIRDIPRINVRAVGTNTLRKARNGREFLGRAQRALGHRIHIITGMEEARLIYLGVSNTTYHQDQRRLVVDIGGGSTELIIGRGFDPLLMESLYMGCAHVTRHFFPSGEISAKKMRRAILYARQELESITAVYQNTGWDAAIGSSGTILCIHEIVRSQGWSDSGITSASLEQLRDQLVKLRKPEAVNFPELSEARKPVFAGGVAILCGVFESLGLERMAVSDGALREGLLHDMIGRAHERDIRDRTINQLLQRYTVDAGQAERVRATARWLFDGAGPVWMLSNDTDRKLLQWAALVHEVGLSIAHAQHHKHAGYLLSNSDLPGFSREEQEHLAMLVRCHRQKFPEAELQIIPAEDRDRVRLLAILLRIAVLLNRSRSSRPLPPIEVSCETQALQLGFPEDWLGRHPLTRADLETEAGHLKATGFTLAYS